MKAIFSIAALLTMLSTTAMAQSYSEGAYYDDGISVLDVPSTLVSTEIGSDTGSPAGCATGCAAGCDTASGSCDSLGCGDIFGGGCDGLGAGCGCGQPGWEFSGWLNGGFMGNFSSPASRFNGPYNAVDRSNEPMLNQLYLIAERGLPRSGTGWGARADFLFGQDYLLAQSVGIERRQDGSPRWNNEHYGVAIPQAFVTVGSQAFNVQAGHFYSVVGYEGLTAPSNFFYSKSYSYQFAGPFTHWGAQANWKANRNWTIQTGLHNGWDAFDRTTDRMGFIGRVRYDSTSTGAWTSFAITTGDETNNLAGLPIATDFTNRTRYSWIASLPVTCRTEYVFHHWLGFQEQGAAGGERADWYGIDQYLVHTLNDRWKVGGRFEWFRDEEGTRVGLNRPSNPNNPPFTGNFYSATLGLSYAPCSHFIVRPECRFDWFDGQGQPFDDGSDDFQSTAGFDAIWMF